MKAEDPNSKEYNDLSDEFKYRLLESQFLVMHPDTHAIITPCPSTEFYSHPIPKKVNVIDVIRDNYTIDLFNDFLKAISIGIVIMSVMYML